MVAFSFPQVRSIKKAVSKIGSSKAIKILMIKNEMTASDLAAKINMSQSTLSKKLKKDDFSESELVLIANALNARHISYFETIDGTIIK